MPKQGKKHEILGGIKVSSKQLSEWGSLGGRPKQHSSNAERQRAYKLRKKQEKFGEKAELRGYKSYGEIQVKKISIICPNCGKVETDLKRYFNEQGEFIKETWWFDTVRMEKRNIRENEFHCSKCSYIFSFRGEKIKVKEVKIIVPKSGSVRERVKRWKEKMETLKS